MRRRDFFDAERHPLARFRSLRVEPVDERRARIVGLLSLRGVEREVVLDATLNRAARHPLTLRRTLGFSAVAEINRADFGMVAWQRMVGPTVTVRIELEAQRARRGATHEGSAPTRDDEETDDAVAQ
jgi:polyisoprenoid-binding protein YceI